MRSYIQILTGLTAITAGLMIGAHNYRDLPTNYYDSRDIEAREIKHYDIELNQHILNTRIVESQKANMLASGVLMGVGLAGIVSGYLKNESDI